jgi:hypothetical protein
MTKEQIGFGLTPQEHPYEEYKGKWVVIYPNSGGWNFVGKVKDYDGENLILNPFQGNIADEEVGLVKALIDENSKIKLYSIVVIEPTTRETVECSLKFDNAQKRKKFLSEQASKKE